MTVMPRMLAGAVLALLLVSGAESAAPPARGVDALGDPLPAGALARLGSIRFRLPDKPTAIAISPDGKLAAAGVEGVLDINGAIHLWEMPSGRPRGVWPLPNGHVGSLAFSPDSRILASADAWLGGWLRLWDVGTGRSRRIGKEGNLGWAAFTPDGLSVAVSSTEEGVRLFDVRTGKLARTFSDKKCSGGVAFTPEGKRLAHGRYNGQIVLRDVKTGEVVGLLEGHSRTPQRLAFSPDGKRLVSGRVGIEAPCVWDVARRRELRRVSADYHSPGLFADKAGSLLTIEQRGKRLIRTDLDTGQPVLLWQGEQTCVDLAVSADGRYALLGLTYPPRLRVLDLKRGLLLATGRGHEDAVSSLAFSPDGRLVATCAGDSSETTVRLWDAASGRCLRELCGHRKTVVAVAFSPDGRTLASGSRDRTVKFWDVPTGRVTKTLTGHGGEVLSLVFCDDGKTLVSGSKFDDFVRAADGQPVYPRFSWRLLYWDVRRGKVLHSHDDTRRDGRSLPFLQLAFVRGGRTVFAAADRLQRWDVETASLLGERAFDRAGWPHLRGWSCLAVSPDGRLLATGTPMYPVLAAVTEISSGKVLWEQRAGDGLTSGLTSVLAFSPDSRCIALDGSLDGVVWVVDAVEGRVIRKLGGHLGRITALAFSPDGRSLAVADRSSQVLIWDVGGPPSPEKQGRTDLDRAYRHLGDEDPQKAHQAIRRLAADPRQSVPYLAKRLRVDFPDERRSYSRLIEELDDDDFEVRQNADATLAKLGRGVAARLRATLAEGKVSLEVRRSTARLLRQIDDSEPTEEQRRHHRAVAALEQMDDDAARRLLLRLAGGHPDAELTRDADASLRRLASRRP
jgi:WD40 repeat protein